MFFRDIIGQDSVRNKLQHAVQENKVAHAMLFLGPEGCGNLAMARAFAQYINCENRQTFTDQSGNAFKDSCGICPNCKKAAKNIHPDIHYTFPFVFISKKNEQCADWMKEWRKFLLEEPFGDYNTWIESLTDDNKQGNINVKEIQDIIHRLSYKNFEAAYKVQIIWLPEYLKEEGNHLLKILEEPPDNTLFILVAHDADRILNTILSRVQITRFPRIQDENVARYLSESLQVPHNEAIKLAMLASGNLQEATRLAEMEEDVNTSMIRAWMEPLYRGNIKQVYAWNEHFLKMRREQQKNFLLYCIHFFREVLLIEAGAGHLARLTDAERRTAEGLGKLLGTEGVTHLLELFDKCIYFVERNVNGKIMMSYVSVVLLRQFKKKNVSTRPFYDHWAL